MPNDAMPNSGPRNIAIFVSSTFRDMQMERDALRDVVVPKFISPVAEEYGVKVELIDLRWGVDTSDVSEEEQNRKVLHTCLDEIQRSQPFFVGLLGDRYGWVPDVSEAAKVVADRRVDDIVPDVTGRSVTALEVEYGALAARGSTAPPCLFYIRRISNPEALRPERREIFFDTPTASERLSALKRTVQQRFRTTTRAYAAMADEAGIVSLGDFCEIVGSDIVKLLREAWGEPPRVRQTALQKEHQLQASLLSTRNRIFAGRTAQVDYLRAFALSLSQVRVGSWPALGSSTYLLLLKGGTGSGKSTLVARLAAQASKEARMVMVFCGASVLSSSVTGVLRYLAWQVGGDSALPAIDAAADFVELRQVFTEVLAAQCAEGRVCLVVDALDQLQGSEARLMQWLPEQLPNNCRIICTLVSGEEESAAQRHGGQVIALPPLDSADIPEVVASLSTARHKQISRDSILMRSITNRVGDTGALAAANPLYLSLLIQYLSMLDRTDYEQIEALAEVGSTAADAISRYLAGRVNALPADADGVYMAIIEKVSAAIGGEFAKDVLCMIAASRFGLREADIKASLEAMGQRFNPADFAWLRHTLGDHLAQGADQEWDFTHQNLRRLLKAQLPEKVFRANADGIVPAMFAAYDPGRGTNTFVTREILYHAWLAGRADIGAAVLTNSRAKPSDYPFASSLATIFASEDTAGDARQSFFGKMVDATKELESSCRVSMYLHLDRAVLGQYSLPRRYMFDLLKGYSEILGEVPLNDTVVDYRTRLFCYLGELSEVPEEKERYFDLAEQQYEMLEKRVGHVAALGPRERLDQTIGDYWEDEAKDRRRALPYFERYLVDTKTSYQRSVTGEEPRIVESLTDYAVGLQRLTSMLLEMGQLEQASPLVREWIDLVESASEAHKSSADRIRPHLFGAYYHGCVLAEKVGDKASTQKYTVLAAKTLGTMYREGDRRVSVAGYYHRFSRLMATLLNPLIQENVVGVVAEELKPVLQQYIVVADEYVRELNEAGQDASDVHNNINLARQASGASSVSHLETVGREATDVVELRQALKDSAESLYVAHPNMADVIKERVVLLMGIARKLAVKSASEDDWDLIARYYYNAGNKLAVVGDGKGAGSLFEEGAEFCRSRFAVSKEVGFLIIGLYCSLEVVLSKATFKIWDGFSQAFAAAKTDLECYAVLDENPASAICAKWGKCLRKISQRAQSLPEQRQSLLLASLLDMCLESAVKREQGFTGTCEMYSLDRSIYRGEVADGVPNGRGQITWPKQFGEFAGQYEGQVQDGRPHGQGRRAWADGRPAWEGQWNHGDPVSPPWPIDASNAWSAYRAKIEADYLSGMTTPT